MPSIDVQSSERGQAGFVQRLRNETLSHSRIKKKKEGIINEHEEVVRSKQMSQSRDVQTE